MRTIIVLKKIIAVIDATFLVAKRKSEKIQACTGFEPLTSAIPMQLSTNGANKPIGSTSLNWFVVNLVNWLVLNLVNWFVLNLVNWLVLNLERNIMIIIIFFQRV